MSFKKPDSPFSDWTLRFEAGKFGVLLFLISLVMLFGATIIGFAVIRIRSDNWPSGLPPVPSILWLSTGVLIVSSLTMQAALRSVRRGRLDRLSRFMFATLALGIAFLLLQATSWWLWMERVDRTILAESDLYRFAVTGFFVLTGVHALHVIGGIVPMTVVAVRSLRNAYSAQRYSGVQYCAMYWHFLDGVWLTLFVVLLVSV